MSCTETINLARFENEKIEFDLHCKQDEINIELVGVVPTGNLKFGGTIEINNDFAVVNGNVSLDLEIECGRCLAPIANQQAFEFVCAYVSAAKLTEEVEFELEKFGFDVSVIEDDILDLGAVAVEQIEVRLPDHPTCRKDCRGICPDCGIDLNHESCNCSENKIDSRWAALKELKKEK
ncbi:MAG: YceD family protein [Pyrinomonadaceae bacterium]